MKRPYMIAAAICLLFAVFVAGESVKLKLYLPMGPGPGFFPLWLSMAFGIFATVMFWQGFRTVEPMPDDFIPARSGVLRIAAILASLGATVVLLEPLGFRLTMFLFFVFLLNALSRQSLILTLVLAAVGSFGVYQVFKGLLNIPLPIGFFGI